MQLSAFHIIGTDTIVRCHEAEKSAYGVNVAATMVERVPLSGILRLCQGVNLRGQQIAGREHKGKVPTGQAAYDQYLDPSISPSLSLSPGRKCPFDDAQCQMDGICFLNTQRPLLRDESLPRASAIQDEARSDRGIISPGES